MPRSEIARQRGVPDNRVAAAAVFLARYDRQAADLFLTQANAALPRGTADSRRFVGSMLHIEASADPRAAVAIRIAFPPPATSRMFRRMARRLRCSTI